MRELVRIPVVPVLKRAEFVGLFKANEHKSWAAWEETFKAWAEDRGEQGYVAERRELDLQEFQRYVRVRTGGPMYPTLRLLLDFLHQIP
ncbi:hypothetical protein [Bosea sp. (in: a-proteobacteria)]|uniref:hypothetical protein n=1 Tax=Bosea sp. (in: a-proteobacteria) TaxID=1871050 RepID=UPI002732E4E7|nr:hypothetical protein [Bosea sp. (in: a-proteobacteria)]MDP3408927.1 hypothetical protein [Bosea sp. (in: a-proteobacteria)]